MNVPVTVYAEMTPNPSTMKFVANKYLLITGDSVEFSSKADAKGYSPMAEELFNFPFVKNVFVAANFITITKTDNVPWDFITMELREFVKNWITEGKDVLIQMPAPKTVIEATDDSPKKEYLPSEYDDAIKSLLDEYVRPAVENDGGAIDFRGFDNGVVTVVMRGSCAGCPSSTATLKGGIENLLKSHLPEVKEVVAEM
ncbi:MAG: NifU family protein [Crocinitomicaceae bacterium]|jgi:NFU1 iron-sulfur cluster scaffold homolog, mitochondrial|nr:NifU family protein [Crocinitomicaceae bacterium]MCF8433804.1 NifU family protein [Crocinitomicaceae bacterium]MDP4683392.1 NifU family protein [Crocinitomicaceae bacterium]MDP5011756.1 NifU family protein [Crocinitomicaceae bacterium]